MRPGLLILPFLSLFFGALGSVFKSSYQEAPVFGYVGWALAAALLLAWILLDITNFKLFFTRKGAKYGASSGAVVLLGILVIVGVASLTSRPRFNKSWDATKTKANTLSDQSLKVIETMQQRKANVKVVAFFQDQEVERQFRDLIGLYQARGADFAAEYVDPKTNPTRAMGEKLTNGNTVIIRLGDQENRVTTFNEEKFTNGILNVLKEGQKKVYFTIGHGEGQLKGSEATGFDFVVQEMENNKYQVAELSLLEQTTIPEDANLVVIAGPKYEFKEEEIKALDAYLKNGGALLTMVDAMTPATTLNKLLEQYGITYNTDFLILSPGDPRAQILGNNNAIVSEFDDFSPVTKDFAKQSQVALLMPFSRSLTEVGNNTNKMKVSLVAKTNKAIMKVKDVTSQADLRTLTQDRVQPGAHPVIAVATGKVGEFDPPKPGEQPGTLPPKPDNKETRIIAVGSSYFARNQGAQQASEHRDLFVNMTNFLMQDEDFISIRPRDSSKSTLQLTTARSQVSLLVLAWVYPFMFLGGGVFYWLRRRRQ